LARSGRPAPWLPWRALAAAGGALLALRAGSWAPSPALAVAGGVAAAAALVLGFAGGAARTCARPCAIIPRMLELIQITNDPAFAQRCDALGGFRLFVDLERLGKAERQAGRNTFISTHQVEDVGRVKRVLRSRR
jgi:hypothetical protein